MRGLVEPGNASIFSMKVAHMIAFLLLAVGGLNWLLVAVMPEWQIGMWVSAQVANIVYVLVGLAALFEIFTHRGRCRDCASGM